MEDSVVDILDELEHRDTAGRHRPLYSITHPQFRVPTQPAPRRDRYRAAPQQEDIYDLLPDDDLYGEDVPLDSFDENLLQQPYQDRQRQAEQGHARLSLPPKRDNWAGTGEYSQAEHRPQPISDLSRFAYNPTGPQEASSDPLLGESSPTFQAGQRRAQTLRQSTFSRRSVQASSRDVEPEAFELPEEEHPAFSSREMLQRHDPHPLRQSDSVPMIQGIPLVLVNELPDRLRTVFPYPTFNAVQSKCFDRIYKSDDNFVLASPTGSGKTVIMELAICRTFLNNAAGQYKIVYQAPIKALCSERQRDWEKKFGPLGLKCIELTGDSDYANLKHVQTADIIITTPEKWDSITRKWRDHEKLMRLIKLFLIDEVHFLKEERGAILEAVVSRMKTIGTDVRFVALSATVPNLGDVAGWIGKNSAAPYLPANKEKFGEEFRPVKLKKHVIGYPGYYNDFQFDSFLDGKLPEIITKYSAGKPIMIFCMTRNSTITTAKMLAKWWSSDSPQRRRWRQPSKPINVQNQDLKNCVPCGVAFHHAGLEGHDRLGVEQGFLDGDISVICCTSTLAVGVNLPCHFVIIKNTITWTNSGVQEYSDLETMQMIGRAGRPQFDDSAIAVILTRPAKVQHYELMVTGQDVLESKLHIGLIEHLNAEVGLGTIRDLSTARKWLSRTFLYVRLKQNPAHYKLEGARSGQNIDEQLDDICLRDLGLLRESNLVTGDERFRCTELGEAMARYYVSFETMRIIVGLQPKAQISEILSALSQASEFRDMKFRAGEKPLYKMLNSSSSIRFSIPVALSQPAHKVSIIIQSVLGGTDIMWDKDTQKHKGQYHNEVAAVFKHVHRLIRCIADCQISLGDSVAVTHALLIQRSLSARAWDDSPMHMRQIPGIGIVAVRKLVNAGIRTIEEMEFAEPQRLEMLLGRNPPFGLKLQEETKLFPKPRVSVHVMPNSTRRTDDGVKIQLKVEIGFLNDKTPSLWQKKPVYVCLLAETSDGRMIHFARISAHKLGNGQELVIPAVMTEAGQSINCYVMCDEIAGTMREASVQPRVAPSMFPPLKTPKPKPPPAHAERPTSNTSKRRKESEPEPHAIAGGDDEFDDGLDDDDLYQASFGDLDFDHIDNYLSSTQAITKQNTAKNTAKKEQGKNKARTASLEEDDGEPKRLGNGKWACNHKCKDKSACKHMCCRDGLDHPRKRTARKTSAAKGEVSPPHALRKVSSKREDKTQMKLQLTASKRKISSDIETLDLTQEKRKKPDPATEKRQDYRNLDRLHKKVQKRDPPASISSITHKKPSYCYSAGGEHNLSFLGDESCTERGDTGTSTDYGDLPTDDLHMYCEDLDQRRLAPTQDRRVNIADELCTEQYSDLFGDDDSLLGEAMVGLADSQDIRAAQGNKEDASAFEDAFDDDFEIDYDVDLLGDDPTAEIPATLANVDSRPKNREIGSSSTLKAPSPQEDKTKSLFFTNTSSPARQEGPKAKISLIKGSALRESNQTNARIQSSVTEPEVDQNENARDENERGTIYGEGSEYFTADEMGDEKATNRDEDLKPWVLKMFGDCIELED